MQAYSPKEGVAARAVYICGVQKAQKGKKRDKIVVRMRFIIIILGRNVDLLPLF